MQFIPIGIFKFYYRIASFFQMFLSRRNVKANLKFHHEQISGQVLMLRSENYVHFKHRKRKGENEKRTYVVFLKQLQLKNKANYMLTNAKRNRQTAFALTGSNQGLITQCLSHANLRLLLAVLVCEAALNMHS